MRYAPEVYSVVSSLKVRSDENPLGGSKLDEILFAQPAKDLQDEMQVFRSRSMAARVVRSLGMEVEYYNKGKIRSSLIYPGDCPFKLNIIKLTDSSLGFLIPVVFVNDQTFKINQEEVSLHFGQVFENSWGSFTLTRTNASPDQYASNEFTIKYDPVEVRAKELVSALSLSQSGESNNILSLNFSTPNSKVGEMILNQWMNEYQQAGLEDKRMVAIKALDFIDQQLDTVKVELGGVEKNLQIFREQSSVYNPEQQSENYFKSLSDFETETIKVEAKLENVKYLSRYIADGKSPNRQVGAVLGIDEPSLAEQIRLFNNYQLERETLLKTTTPSNPTVQSLDGAIQKLRSDILTNLRNIQGAYEAALRGLSEKRAMRGKEISQMPGKERKLLDIARRQKILEELYSFLLQRKLETSISSASTISSVKVIEPAESSSGPVEPNRRKIFLLAFVLGAALPLAVIFLFEYFNDKVVERSEIQNSTSAPIVGEVGHSDVSQALVVNNTSRKFIAEQFRILRSNVQYVLPRKEKFSVLITSSSSGEGKSFISVNVGAVMALSRKKTVVLEFDIRKPRIMSSLNLGSKPGITNYLIGKASMQDLLVPVPGFDNFFVIPCGPIPPNPSELLLDSKIDDLFAWLKTEFDVVVIDSAPIGLVSDAISLGAHADISLYIIRHNYTFKKQLRLLNEMYETKRLPQLCIVVNDIKMDGGYGNYYGYGSYSVGYGYSYGGEYFEERKSPTLMERLSKIFIRHRK